MYLSFLLFACPMLSMSFFFNYCKKKKKQKELNQFKEL